MSKTVIRKSQDIYTDICNIKKQAEPLVSELVETIIQEWLQDHPEIAKLEVYTEWEYNDNDYDPRASICKIEYVIGDTIEINQLDWSDPKYTRAELLSEELTLKLEDYRVELNDGGTWERVWEVTNNVHSVSI